MKPVLTSCVVILMSASVAPAQDGSSDFSPSQASDEPAQTTQADAPELNLRERPPLGWLSDPDESPADLLDALVSGKIHFDDRLRLEIADTTGRDTSYAITNRLRLGYETRPFRGFSALIEFENVATPDSDLYSVPPAGQGDPDRTPIADPRGTEANQAYGRFDVASLGDTGVSFDLRAGRQRIILDDARFIGNVGWRQFEQTFDAASVRSDLGVEGLSAFYAYVWGVQRIFGPDGPNPDAESHLLNLSYAAAPELKITPFAHLLDFRGDDPLNSSNSLGVRLTGDLWKDAADEQDLFAAYELTYARQSDAGANPIDYDADFVAGQLRVTKQRLGHALLGYQFLGSDDGNFAFRFPLGTNHAFQGFADNFLTTPAVGLQDLYVGIGADLPWGVKGAVIYHEFWSDEGGDDLGEELDFVASKQITPIWSVLVKGAYFDGDSGQPDTVRFWVQTELKF